MLKLSFLTGTRLGPAPIATSVTQRNVINNNRVHTPLRLWNSRDIPILKGVWNGIQGMSLLLGIKNTKITARRLSLEGSSGRATMAA